jgi:2TM domain
MRRKSDVRNLQRVPRRSPAVRSPQAIFYTVLGVWIALSLMWFLIDLADDSSSYWFYWPMLGTGIAVAITGIVLLGIGGLFGADWERREIDRYLRRRGKQPDA